MGLNSTYIITVKKEQLDSVDEYLKRNCKLNEKQIDSPINSKSNCMSLILNVDSSIKKYIRNYYYSGRFSGDYQDENLEDRIVNNQTSIGCVDLSIETFNDKVNVKFVCVTSAMSHLFAESKSIRKWFVELCKFAKAETGIFDCENEYFELIWFKNNESNLQVSPELIYDFKYYPEKNPSLKPIDDLIIASYDYAYKHKR